MLTCSRQQGLQYGTIRNTVHYASIFAKKNVTVVLYAFFVMVRVRDGKRSGQPAGRVAGRVKIL